MSTSHPINTHTFMAIHQISMITHTSTAVGTLARDIAIICVASFYTSWL